MNEPEQVLNAEQIRKLGGDNAIKLGRGKYTVLGIEVKEEEFKSLVFGSWPTQPVECDHEWDWKNGEGGRCLKCGDKDWM